MQPVILDQFGRPANYVGKEWYKGPGDSAYRQAAPRLDADIRAMLDQYKHLVMISDSRNIVRSNSTLGGAIAQKATMVSTNQWQPVFDGDDEEWGNVAEAQLERHLRLCDVRGQNFNFANSYKIASWLLDVDGDCFRVKVTHPTTGMPLIQSFEAHRISSPNGAKTFQASWFENAQSAETKQLAKELDGALVQNGIVLGEYGEQLAIIITDGSALRTPIALVPQKSYFHFIEPQWFSENRGIPKVIAAVLDWYDMQETRDAEKIKQKIHSRLALTEENSTGYAPFSTGSGINAAETGKPQVHEMENGLVRYFKAGSGGKITQLNSITPGDSWQRFQTEIEEGALYALKWSRMLKNPAGIRSANMHAIAEQINYSIFERFDTLERYARAELQWYVSGLIQLGKIPQNKEWYKWTVSQPAEFTANTSRKNAATIEAIRAGIETHPRVIRALGGRPLQWLKEQAKFVKAAKRIADEEGILITDLIQTGKPGDPVVVEESPMKQDEESDADEN